MLNLSYYLITKLLLELLLHTLNINFFSIISTYMLSRRLLVIIKAITYELINKGKLLKLYMNIIFITKINFFLLKINYIAKKLRLINIKSRN